MKKIIGVAMVLTMFIACKKTTHKPKYYKSVNETAVPAAVTSAFKTKHPDATNKKWLIKKDNSNYVALFQNNKGTEVMSLIDDLGNFQKENEVSQEQENEIENETENESEGGE